MAFDPLDFTNYQHPPCMFVLWYVFVLANYLLGTMGESSAEQPAQENPEETAPALEPAQAPAPAAT